jgi:hypothetical protein
MLLVSAATGLPAGQLAQDEVEVRAIPDPAENLILFSHLETQGACSNLPR